MSVETGGSSAAQELMPSAPAAAAGLPQAAGAAEELIQLLTPEGRAGPAPRLPPRPLGRRDCRASTATWCSSAGSTPRPPPCSARASWASGPPCSARRPRRSAPGRALQPAGHGVPDLPRARRRLVPRRRPAQAARAVPRRQPRRLGPGRAQVPPVHDRDRRPDAARHRLRHGHPARRGAPERRRGGDRLLRRRRHQPGRRERGVRLGRVIQRAGRVLLPEQPVGDLRAAGAADPDPALPAGPRASASPACGSTATTCSPAWPSPGPRCEAAREGQGPTLIEAFTYRMGAHTTTDDPTRYRIAAELEAWKLQDPIERVKAYLVRSRAGRHRLLRAGRRRGGRARAPSCARRAWRMPDPAPLAMFEHVYAEPHADHRRRRQRDRVRAPTSADRFEERSPRDAAGNDHDHAGQGA